MMMNHPPPKPLLPLSTLLEWWRQESVPPSLWTLLKWGLQWRAKALWCTFFPVKELGLKEGKDWHRSSPRLVQWTGDRDDHP